MMASRGLAGEGDSGGEKTNPVFAARNIAFSQLVRAGSMLGLDPLSSLRGGSSSKRDEHNEFDRF
ncbi:phage terminase small subunit [Pantoea agglomerans]|jgi:phage terminase small subunit|nr:phage terminase small subunit [Pantoea agglomerans]